MKCPKCGQQLPDDASFCLKCENQSPIRILLLYKKAKWKRKKLKIGQWQVLF